MSATVLAVGAWLKNAACLLLDGQPQAEYPGTVHVAGPVPQAVTPGCTLKFVA